MRVAAAVVVVVASFACAARAQPGEPWLIVPTTSTANDGWMVGTTRALRTELLQQGVEVWSPSKESAEFEARVSRPPAAIRPAELEAWATHTSTAFRALGLGDYDTALADLEKAQALSRRAPEELNRDPERAQQVLDACFNYVRAFIETGREGRAKALARECRSLVPRGKATKAIHPPWVIELLREVDASRETQSGGLRVDSEPSGCVARLNGVVVGETPVEIGRLFPGEYRVQVECDPEIRGRVHVVRVADQQAELLVDPRFDRVVESEPLVHLRYASPADEARHRISDAERIASTLPSSAILIESMPTSDTIQFELFDHSAQGEAGKTTTLGRARPAVPGAGVLALVRIRAGSRGPSRGDLALAARALAARHCTDFTGPQPVALACAGRPAPGAAEPPGPVDDRPAGRRPRGQFISGLTLFGAGSASLITSFVLLAPRANIARDWVNDVDAMNGDISSQERWLSLNASIYATAGIGGTLLVTAMPLALPNRDKTPWWAWVSGGVGLGLAAFSIAYGVGTEPAPATSCSSDAVSDTDARTCVTRTERIGFAVLPGVAAAPLLTMPLVYLFRPSKSRLEPSVELGRTGGLVRIRGRF